MKKKNFFPFERNALVLNIKGTHHFTSDQSLTAVVCWHSSISEHRILTNDAGWRHSADVDTVNVSVQSVYSPHERALPC